MVKFLDNCFCRVVLAVSILPLLGALAACSTQTGGLHPGGVAGRASEAGKLRLRQVDVFSNGLVFFEFQGIVENDSQQTIRFAPGQIKGVLRSLVFQDTGGGNIGGVVFPTRSVTAKTRSAWANLAGRSSLRDILKQLRGTAVALYLKGHTRRPLKGKIISLTRSSGSRDSGLVVRANAAASSGNWTINFYSNHGLKVIALATVQFIRIEDPRVRAAFGRGLAALAGPAGRHQRESARKLTLLFNGHGRRLVRFGYLLETPAWRMSYRLILPAASKSAAAAKGPVLQALATVANQTAADWTSIRMDISGEHPVSLIPSATQTPVSGGAAGAAQVGGNVFGGGGGVAQAYQAPARRFNPLQGVQALAISGRTHPAFDYSLPGVSLARRHSALLPVLVTPIVTVHGLSAG